MFGPRTREIARKAVDDGMATVEETAILMAIAELRKVVGSRETAKRVLRMAAICEAMARREENGEEFVDVD